jgi:hypothetical protein
MLEQFRDPLSILLVGLLSRNVPDVLRVGQPEFEATLENVPHGLPVDAGGLHSHQTDLVMPHPTCQTLEFLRGGSKHASVLADVAFVINLSRASGDTVLVDVQAAAAAVHDVFHDSAPFAACWRTLGNR